MPEVDYDPAEGGVGYLTFDQWDRLTRAWQTAYRHLSWWWVAGHVRGGSSEDAKRRTTEHALPLPATWLAAHEITRLMQELNRWTELEDAANDIDGHEFALLLTREVETAAAKWPLSDRTHRVSHFRCEACQQLTLKYFPPNVGSREDAPKVDVQARFALRPNALREVELLDVVVRCTDPECRAVMSSTRFEIAVKLIEFEEKQREQRRLAASKASGSAVQTVGENDPALGFDGPGGEVEAGERVVVLSAGSDPSGQGDNH